MKITKTFFSTFLVGILFIAPVSLVLADISSGTTPTMVEVSLNDSGNLGQTGFIGSATLTPGNQNPGLDQSPEISSKWKLGNSGSANHLGKNQESPLNNSGNLNGTTVFIGSVTLTPEGGNVSPYSRLMGDLNGDGEVDFTDWIMFHTNWGSCPDNAISCSGLGDFDQNGQVNSNDEQVIFENWTAPPVSLVGMLDRCLALTEDLPSAQQSCWNRLGYQAMLSLRTFMGGLSR